jgi:DNA-directed RNA polymerase subunit M/transcription elongation factor TFIIS
MATTGIRISCPNCQQQMNVPESVRGKKVRCKGCGGVISVPSGVDTRVRTEKAQAKATAAATRTEEDEAANPYGVTETNLDPRCPHCGYDMMKRQRRPSIKTYERTAGNWFSWLFPGFANLFGFFVIIGAGIYYHYWLPFDILKEKDAAALLDDRLAVFNKDPGPDFVTYMFHPGIEVWFAVVALILMWKTGKFAFKRLILNYMPPESIKEK